MKKVSKMASVILMVCVLLSNVLPMEGIAASIVSKGNMGKNIKWEFDSNGVFTLRGSGEIPYAWNECMPVSQWAEVKKIVIGEGITVIDMCRFSKFKNVESVVIPASVYKIDKAAFEKCSKLQQVYYSGSSQQWARVQIGADNAPLTNARITYYSNGTSASSQSQNTSGNKTIKVKIGPNFLSFDVEPQTINGRTMVPMRTIFEAFGARILWNDATQTVTAIKDGMCLKITIGSNVMYRNNLPISLDAPACTIQGRTMVPVRAIAESFGVGVEWDAYEKTVYIEQLNNSLVFLCAEDGRVERVSTSKVAEQKKVGWYDYPVARVYESSGSSMLINMTEVDAYMAQGWYDYPVVTVYAADGRTMVIAKAELQAYQAVGWYHLYPMTIYAPDGRTMQIMSSELAAYKAVGWYGSVQEVKSAVVAHLNKTVSVKLIIPRVGTMNNSAKIQIKNTSGNDLVLGSVMANGESLYEKGSTTAKNGYITTAELLTLRLYVYNFRIDEYDDTYTMYLDNNSSVFIEAKCNDVTYYARGDVYGNTTWGTSRSAVGWY